MNQFVRKTFHREEPLRARGMTMLELLVVIGVISLLLAVLLPALATVRAEGTKAKCLGNLHSLGQAFASYTTDDPSGFTSPVHPKAETSWYFDGDYDFGGQTGSPDSAWGNSDFAADRRILNRYLFDTGDSSPLELYDCSGDAGMQRAPIDHEPAFFAGNNAHRKVFQVTGTSYRLNHHIDYLGISPYTRHFYGPYLRPQSRVPNTADTILLEEAVAEVAKWNDPKFVTTGWHRKPNMFNVLFTDGHASTIHLLGQGNPLTVSGDPDYWIWRGEGWRMDCYPDKRILDKPRPGP